MQELFPIQTITGGALFIYEQQQEQINSPIILPQAAAAVSHPCIKCTCINKQNAERTNAMLELQ